MTKKKKGSATEKLSQAIVKGMLEKKAGDITVLDLRKVKNAMADYFVICSGNSDKQINAIADSIDDEVFKEMKENAWHVEGRNSKDWLLLDYINVVAHVFSKDKREYFALEKLWGDAEITQVSEGMAN